MGGKKKKAKREEGASDGGNNPGLVGSSSDGKQSKRRQKDYSDDLDDDLSELATEMGITGGVSVPDTSCAMKTTESDKLKSDIIGEKKKAMGNELEVGPSTTKSLEPVKLETRSEITNEDNSVASAKIHEDEDVADGDKKKKKKKKKKPSEEERKPKGASKAVLSKIKKVQAALEEEKRRREEEALMAQRAEEERERARAEKLRLEQERKERLKQKEKERKIRRKLEGKPVTKKERDAESRRLAQLAALEAQGMTVPEKSGGDKKVVYGSRTRNKKGRSEPTKNSDVVKEKGGDDGDTCDSGLEETVGNEEDISGALESWEALDTNDSEEAISLEGDRDIGEVSAEMPSPTMEDAESKEEGEVDDETSSNSTSSSEEEEELSAYEKAKRRIHKRRGRHAAECSVDTLRSPVVCVLGHVDTGKTKILDKIRRTNVQDGEAGGITQQIGATFVPLEAIKEQTKMLKEFSKGEINLPGLLIIDTPGHESFRNLRTRGSSMCDLAILVVDIMHGLEPQTLESLGLLLKGKTPFVVALNKIDRLFDWHRNPSAGIRDTLKRQKPNTREEFDERVKQVSTEFAEQGLNVALFWEKVDFTEYVALVPTSAITGDGMGDLIALLVEYSSKNLAQSLMLSMEIEAMVMEVKVIAGLGTTIDVILRNGVLKEGDMLVLMGNDGPFVVTVRALLMPQPLRELRVKNAYISHSAVMAAQGIKVTAKGDLDKALAGTSVLVAKRPDEIDVLKDEAAKAMRNVLNAIKLQERGVYVQASTLGSLEALLDFLTQSKIPYSGISIGPVHKKDVMKASVMLEHDSQWAVILAFDVRVERDAQEMAENLGVKIFSADIIYHLFDAFLKHRQELREKNRQQYQSIAVFPCKLRVLPNCIFNTRDPIVVGVVVEAGIVKPGTPLTVPSKNFTDIGVVTSLEVNHKPVEMARKGVEVCLKIESMGGEAPRLYGRHFDHTDTVVSKITRESIDAVKNYFREDLLKTDWQLMIELKKTFQIM